METNSQDEALYDSIKTMRAKHPGKYVLYEVEVCRTFYIKALGIGSRRVMKMLASVSNHSRIPPEDRRTSRLHEDGAAYQCCDCFFLFLYNHLAEPLSEHDSELRVTKEDDPIPEGMAL